MRNVYVGLSVLALLSWGSATGCGGDGTNTASNDGGTTTTTDDPTTGGGGGDDCAASERCNGLDDDCDGEVDEGCACIEGDSQSCWSGDPDLVGIGSCTAGTQSCDDQGQWGSCEGEVLPSDEICDGNDNDCDGSEDEGFGQVTCGLGVCQVTVQECIDGVPNPCVPDTGNPVELCDGVDDDCDGTVDNGCACTNGQTQPCYGGPPNTQNVGVCVGGTQTCVNGTWSSDCVGDVLPTSETCNGNDDDCNNVVDDNNPGGGLSCQAQAFGICQNGTTLCQGGGIVCQPGQPLPSELCNNLDDDCDNSVDEGNPGGGAACTANAPGICANGTETCLNGSIQCAPGQPLPSEICNNLDDDCDNAVDEGNPGGGSACSTGLQGICAAGTITCGGGSLGCVQNQQAAPNEICGNGLDDNCNGSTDENCCAHDKCTSGIALVANCDPCVQQICAVDAYCCDATGGAWDSLCQKEVFEVCNSTECGTCTMPLNPAAECGSGHHCEPHTSGTGLCIAPVGPGGTGAACNDDDDCQANFSCIFNGLFTECLQWCNLASPSCPSNTSCGGLNTPVFIGNQEWGVCG